MVSVEKVSEPDLFQTEETRSRVIKMCSIFLKKRVHSSCETCQVLKNIKLVKKSKEKESRINEFLIMNF